MEKYDSTSFFHLGYAFSAVLRSIDNSKDGNIDLFEAVMFKNSLDQLIAKHKELKFTVKAAKEVIDIVMHLEQFIVQGFNNVIVDSKSYSKSELRCAMTNLLTFLTEEVPNLNIFYVPKHRAYDMDTLINEGENILSPNTLNILVTSKSEVITDVREAARSLAFGSYTAVGFHLYRAIEAIVTDEYFVLLGLPAAEIKENNPNLGTYLKILTGIHGKYKIAPIDTKITSLLDHIRDRYRNPIAHPDEFWDADKANNAIGPAISLIDMMAQDIEEIKNRT